VDVHLLSGSLRPGADPESRSRGRIGSRHTRRPRRQEAEPLVEAPGENGGGLPTASRQDQGPSCKPKASSNRILQQPASESSGGFDEMACRHPRRPCLELGLVHLAHTSTLYERGVGSLLPAREISPNGGPERAARPVVRICLGIPILTSRSPSYRAWDDKDDVESLGNRCASLPIQRV
jgi:hypothetical protein